jgi:hypothetical protein
VAIPTYNGRHLLEVILPTLAAQTFSDFEVVVVDDASTDDTVAWLKAEWPEIEVIALERNGGVTAAMNRCVQAGSGELIALFNNDLELDPSCLGELVAALSTHPRAGSAAAKLLDFHDRTVIDGAGDELNWAAEGSRRGHGELDQGQYEQPCDIFGACAGAALYRRAAFDHVGHFDEDFYAVYEDVDWDLRAQLAGFSCRYVPTAVVYHMGSATIGPETSDFVRYQLWRNGLWIIAKDLPLAAILRHAPRLALGQLANIAIAVRDRKVRVLARAWRDAIKALPAVLRKRRAVQSRRTISGAELERVVG